MENKIDKIQDYIDGLLEGDELIQFEKQLLEDEALRQEVSMQQEVQGIIQHRLDSKEDELRKSLKNAQAVLQSRKSSTNIYKLYLPIVAAACLLVFFSLFFFYSNDNSLYDLPTMQSEVVRGQEENVRYENAVKAFNAKSYEEAREMLNTLIAVDPSILQYQYYAALTYFGEQNWSLSIQELTPIADGKSIFADEAKYYLAASYHQIDQKDEAIRLLEQIPITGKLGKKAAEFLETLR